MSVYHRMHTQRTAESRADRKSELGIGWRRTPVNTNARRKWYHFTSIDRLTLFGLIKRSILSDQSHLLIYLIQTCPFLTTLLNSTFKNSISNPTLFKSKKTYKIHFQNLNFQSKWNVWKILFVQFCLVKNEFFCSSSSIQETRLLWEWWSKLEL